MSAAEFVVCGTLVVGLCSGIHEVFRIHSVLGVAQYTAAARAAELSYTGLDSILSGQFADLNGVNPARTAIENNLAEHLISKLSVPLLARGWFSDTLDKSSPLRVRVRISGPRFGDELQDTNVRIHICLRSWLEPLLKTLSDGRNCIGEYLPHGSGTLSRGLSLSVFAKRNAGIAIHPYFKFSRPAEARKR